MVESLSLTQEIVGSSTALFSKIILFLSLNSANSVKTFRENSIVPLSVVGIKDLPDWGGGCNFS